MNATATTALGLSILAILAGMLFPTQTAINAKLSAVVGSPVLATLISFIAGLGPLLVLSILTVRAWPTVDTLRQQPPWLFFAGGLLGATYLGLNVFLVPRIGTGAMMALAVGGQMIAALSLDTTGLFGLTVRDLSPGRLIGAICVVIGAAMVRLL